MWLCREVRAVEHLQSSHVCGAMILVDFGVYPIVKHHYVVDHHRVLFWRLAGRLSWSLNQQNLRLSRSGYNDCIPLQQGGHGRPLGFAAELASTCRPLTWSAAPFVICSVGKPV